jgi:hypothetical protein
MVTRYYIYGVVHFTTANRRNAAARRLDGFAARAGFVPDLWDLLLLTDPTWTAGRQNVETPTPGFRFCYSTTSRDDAVAADADIAAAWDVFADSNSEWSMTSRTTPT